MLAEFIHTPKLWLSLNRESKDPINFIVSARLFCTKSILMIFVFLVLSKAAVRIAFWIKVVKSFIFFPLQHVLLSFFVCSSNLNHYLFYLKEELVHCVFLH